MEIMIGIIIGLFAVAGIIILVKANRKKDDSSEKDEVSIPVSDCCGAHEVCDFDQIKMDESIIEYYDDEELNVYKNKNAKDYSNSQIEQFREVLYTLKPKEIKHWLLSIERRKIQLPTILLSEARTLMAEG
jgi:hypothetical protein